MKRDLKVIMTLIAFVLLTSDLSAFRLLNYVQYDGVSREAPTIWIDFDPGVFEGTFSENDYEGSLSNPLEGIPEDQQIMEIVRRVMEDYNSITGAYLRLNFKPSDEISYPTLTGSEDDEPYDDVRAFKRIVKVKLAGTNGVTAGYATWETDDLEETACTVVIGSTNEVKGFQRTLTHELGHCMGLGHVHEDRDSVMGYNATDQNVLGVDDKMGLIYLYPVDDDLARETATLGLACQPRK